MLAMQVLTGMQLFASWYCCDRQGSSNDNLAAALASVREQDASFLQRLEERRKALNQERSQVSAEINKKRKRDQRTMDKAAKNLSSEQLMLVASKKIAAEAKAKSSSSRASAGLHCVFFVLFAERHILQDHDD